MNTTTTITPIASDTAPACPEIARPDDISPALANSAFSGTSFSPEIRGESRRKEYAAAVNALYAELYPLAKTDQQRATLAEEMERFRQGYLRRWVAFLASHSRVISPMITGPARFPSERNRKRCDIADRRLKELCEFLPSVRSAIRRKLWELQPTETKLDHHWKALRAELLRSLQQVHGIDTGKIQWSNRSAFVNSVVGKVERLARNGESELVERATKLVEQFNRECLADGGKPAIVPRNKFWGLLAIAREAAAAQQSASQADSEIIASGEGIEIIADPQLDRVQIRFPGKPSPEILNQLRRNGWRWSPSNSAWQRKLTNAAKYNASQITGLRLSPSA